MLHAIIMAAARRHRSGEYVRLPSLEEQIDRDTSILRDGERGRREVEAQGALGAEGERERDASGELLDVPATVVCAFCGDADCAGCQGDLSRSGIVSIIAWERPMTPVLSRLWSTARGTTRDAEGFFELLPDGPLMPALRFAALCELLATTAFFMVLVGILAVVAPSWLASLARDPDGRSFLLRVIVLGLPAFSGLLVLAHAVHGLSVDVGATRSGARSARVKALRFGLYACGWDLVMGPIGAVVVPLKEGLTAALRLAGSLNGLPTRATLAFLRGSYRLDGERARGALRTSYVGAIVATLVFSVVVVLTIVIAAMA